VSAFAADFRDVFRELAVLAAVLAKRRVLRDGAFAGRMRALLWIRHGPSMPSRANRLLYRKRLGENVRIMALDIRTLPRKRLAAIRHTGPYNQIGPAFQELGKIAGPAGLFGLPGAMMAGVYFDDPRTTPSESLRSAAGVIVPEGAAIPAGLVEEHIEGGSFAVLTHTGSYEGLPDAWHRAMAELPSTGRKPRNAPSCELYLNDPSQVPESQLKTEIWLPIE
jgi:AraC family transcriptional regulator